MPKDNRPADGVHAGLVASSPNVTERPATRLAELPAPDMVRETPSGSFKGGRSMSRDWNCGGRALGVVVALLAVAACGDDNAQPAQAPLGITKAPTKSGDQQNGQIGQALPGALRVLVTRDGEPVGDIPVNWGTGSGSISPRQGSTATDGITTGTWTLGDAVGTQTATA